MNYDSIAYKVEDGVITNITLVNPQDPIDPGFIKRTYPLNVGYVEKFDDLYPEEYTQEQYIVDLSNVTNNITTYKNIANIKKDTLLSQLNNLDISVEGNTELSDIVQETIIKLNKYIDYLDNFIVQNPLQQKLFTYEESGLWDAM